MKHITAALLLSTLCFGCKKEPKKDPNAIPPATQVGANKMACKINGKLEVFEGVPSYFDPLGVKIIFRKSLQSENIDIIIRGSGRNFEGRNQGLNLFIVNDNLQTGIEYDLATYDIWRTESFYQIDDYDVDKISGYNYLDTSKKSTVKFTYLTDKIASGTFQFYGVNQNDTQYKVNITEGWFDISR